MCKPNTNLYCPKGAHCAKPVQDNKQVHLHGHVHAVLIVKYFPIYAMRLVIRPR
jgi:hypothetical protein